MGALGPRPLHPSFSITLADSSIDVADLVPGTTGQRDPEMAGIGARSEPIKVGADSGSMSRR